MDLPGPLKDDACLRGRKLMIPSNHEPGSPLKPSRSTLGSLLKARVGCGPLDPLVILGLGEILHSAISAGCSHLINPADWLCSLTGEGPCQDPDGS